MKTTAQIFLLAATMIGAAAAHADRYIDNPNPARGNTATQPAGSAEGGGYSGRPNEAIVIEPGRTDGEAEFAVMTTEDLRDERGDAIFNGRPMDNPVR